MDPERQPLLRPSTSGVQHGYRPLTHEEVKATRRELPWRRVHLLLMLTFWGIIAMFISIIVCMLITAPPCSMDMDPRPSVPSSHLTFAPLISRARMNQVFAL